MTTQHYSVFDFAHKPRFIRVITAITWQHAHTAKKPVRIAETPDEDSEVQPTEPEPSYQRNDATTEPSHGENGEISSGAAE
ncbi:unnamed protein product [Phytophthora fragariaefolia]|uniref:Unnamed protein product n=1 Tax=Phytophthora fragariaefolia TaxID=1490495 RepID=A0A9W6XVK3_9STRA|nr:unnamed protein product [Phytophthora fragariaefolia]